MKIKFKRLILASALGILFASEAQAVSTTTNPDLFLIAYNQAEDGTPISTFIASLDSTKFGYANSTGPLTSNTLNLATAYSTQWTAFTGATNYSAANTTYAVLGVFEGGGPNTSTPRMIATSFPALSSGTVGNNASLFNVLDSVTSGGTLDDYFHNTLTAVTGYTTGTSALTVLGSSNGYFGQLGETFGGVLNFSTTQTLGQAVSINRLSPTGTSNAATLSFQNLGDVTLSTSGMLTVAAVPESDPLTMMLVGIGLIGIVVNRKNMIKKN